MQTGRADASRGRHSGGFEGVQAGFGGGRGNTQVPVLGDEPGQCEFGGEADPDHPRLLSQRCRTVGSEGAVVEATAVAQAGTVDAEPEGRNEDEVEADPGRQQLFRSEEACVALRFSDAPFALRFESGHRSRDLAERERLSDFRDDRQEHCPPGGKETVDSGVEVRFPRKGGIRQQGADRAGGDEFPRGVGHGRDGIGSHLGGGVASQTTGHGRDRTGSHLGAGTVRASGTDVRTQLSLGSR